MTTAIQMLLSFLAGSLLGGFFFAGLWFTLQQNLYAKPAALWLMLSFLSRCTLVLWAMYWVAQGQWQGFTACLLGFVMMRFALFHWLEVATAKHSGKTCEPNHAP